MADITDPGGDVCRFGEHGRFDGRQVEPRYDGIDSAGLADWQLDLAQILRVHCVNFFSSDPATEGSNSRRDGTY